jgi:hypothetical protein
MRPNVQANNTSHKPLAAQQERRDTGFGARQAAWRRRLHPISAPREHDGGAPNGLIAGARCGRPLAAALSDAIAGLETSEGCVAAFPHRYRLQLGDEFIDRRGIGTKASPSLTTLR